MNLPSLPPKGDVSDWLDAGHTVQELMAPVWESAGGPANIGEHTGDSEADGEGQETRRSAADRLVELALTSGAVLFHDQRGEAHVAFLQKSRRQIWPARSQALAFPSGVEGGPKGASYGGRSHSPKHPGGDRTVRRG